MPFYFFITRHRFAVSIIDCEHYEHARHIAFDIDSRPDLMQHPGVIERV